MERCSLPLSMKRRAFLGGLGAAGGLAFAPALAGAGLASRNRALERLREARIDVVAHGFVVGGKKPVPGYPTESFDISLARAASARRRGGSGSLALTATA